MAYYLDKMRMRRGNLRVVGTRKNILAKEKVGQNVQLTLGNYDIGGMACLNSGILVTLDTATNKLKVFDRNYRYISQTPVSIFSRSLTFTSDMEAAVLCGKNIFFYVLIGKVIKREPNKIIALRFTGYRFTYSRNHFAVSCDVPHTGGVLLIIDEKGNEINCIRRIRSFGEITSDVYVALDDSVDRLYCTNSKERRIVGLRYNGEVIFGIEVAWTPQLLTCVEDYIAVVNVRGKSIKFLKKKDGKTVDITPVYLKRQPRHLIYDAVHRRLLLFSRSANGAITVVSTEKLLQLSLRID